MKEFFHFFRHPITLFLLGWVIRIIGHAIKIMHHRGGNELLIVAAALQILGLLYAIILIRKIKITR